MIFYVITTLFVHTFLILNFVGTQEENMREQFQNFKNQYHREYRSPQSEQEGFKNFVENTKIVERLNSNSPGKRPVYMLNRYADLNPEEINEHFGVQINPYDNVVNVTKETLERQQRQKFIEDMHLYDLNEVEDLYKIWVNKWGKENFTKQLDRVIHYYRFIKTVGETNLKKFKGQDVTLGPDADMVREPKEYFYG